MMNDKRLYNIWQPVGREARRCAALFAVKQPAPEEAAYCRNRFYLGTAWSDLASGEGEPQRWEPWELDAVAYVDARVRGWSGLQRPGSAKPALARRAALACDPT